VDDMVVTRFEVMLMVGYKVYRVSGRKLYN
jgi:hypothetical protein